MPQVQGLSRESSQEQKETRPEAGLERRLQCVPEGCIQETSYLQHRLRSIQEPGSQAVRDWVSMAEPRTRLVRAI